MSVLPSSMVSNTFSSKVKQKQETFRGFQCWVKVKKTLRAYSQVVVYQQQEKKKNLLLLLHWCLEGVCTQVCCTFLFSLPPPDLHFCRGLSQHVCRWITVVITDKSPRCSRDNKRDHTSYVHMDGEFPSERKPSTPRFTVKHQSLMNNRLQGFEQLFIIYCFGEAAFPEHF